MAEELLDLFYTYKWERSIVSKADLSVINFDLSLLPENKPEELVSQPSPASIASSNPSSPDTSQGLLDGSPRSKYICHVCGDEAGKHKHYGGQVCKSCRAFFRRAVEHSKFVVFGCKHSGNCNINHKSRTRCMACRFQMCLKAGMSVPVVTHYLDPEGTHGAGAVPRT